MTGRDITRRSFLVVSGGAGAGLVLGVSLIGCNRRAEAIGALGPGALNAWIRIGTDDTVTFLISESEMGQGTHTALAMLLAEELEVPWARVRTEYLSDLERRQHLAHLRAGENLVCNRDGPTCCKEEHSHTAESSHR